MPLKRSEEDYLFSYEEKTLTNSRSWTLMEHFRKETGLSITPHELRHAFASMCFEAGLDAKTLQTILGHAQISTTMDIYTHLRDSALDAAAVLLDNHSF